LLQKPINKEAGKGQLIDFRQSARRREGRHKNENYPLVCKLCRQSTGLVTATLPSQRSSQTCRTVCGRSSTPKWRNLLGLDHSIVAMYRALLVRFPGASGTIRRATFRPRWSMSLSTSVSVRLPWRRQPASLACPVTRSVPVRSFGSAAPPTKEEIEERILDVLRGFDKVDKSKVHHFFMSPQCGCKPWPAH
jgi:hypothetical protein